MKQETETIEVSKSAYKKILKQFEGIVFHKVQGSRYFVRPVYRRDIAEIKKINEAEGESK